MFDIIAWFYCHDREEREVVAVMDVMRAVRVRSPGQDNPASMLTGKHPSKLFSGKQNLALESGF